MQHPPMPCVSPWPAAAALLSSRAPSCSIRPLCPACRPRSKFSLSLDGPPADVAAALHAVEVNRVDGLVSPLLRDARRIAQRGDDQHPAARGAQHALRVERGTGMEGDAVGGLGRNAGDGVALARVFRVAMCGEHHAQGGAAVPLQFHLIELPGDGLLEHHRKIALETGHDGLGFRVAHAAVEFQRLGAALGVDHQPGVEKAGERNAVGRHAFDGGQDDFAHHPRVHFGRDHGRW